MIVRFFGFVVVLAAILCPAQSDAATKVEQSQANARQMAGKELVFYYYREGWKGQAYTMYFLEPIVGSRSTYEGRFFPSHPFYGRLRAMKGQLGWKGVSTSIVFRYVATPKQEEAQYAAAYLVPVKYAIAKHRAKKKVWRAFPHP